MLIYYTHSQTLYAGDEALALMTLAEAREFAAHLVAQADPGSPMELLASSLTVTDFLRPMGLSEVCPCGARVAPGRETCGLTDACMDRLDALDDEAREIHQPPAGSWAATARMMADAMPIEGDPGFWDRWKDEMKEGGL